MSNNAKNLPEVKFCGKCHYCHRDFYVSVVSADGTLLCKD